MSLEVHGYKGRFSNQQHRDDKSVRIPVGSRAKQKEPNHFLFADDSPRTKAKRGPRETRAAYNRVYLELQS